MYRVKRFEKSTLIEIFAARRSLCAIDFRAIAYKFNYKFSVFYLHKYLNLLLFKID